MSVSPPRVDEMSRHSVAPTERAVVEHQTGDAPLRERLRVLGQPHVLKRERSAMGQRDESAVSANLPDGARGNANTTQQSE